ncbi:MAG TPA: DUF427 domain-containing protein [Gaiellaceae bacterium]|nr:DUF427 domain-containing protein [Gaiellaceae bacterium]
MSLTAGSGPFGERPQGRFNFDPQPPGAAIFWEPVPYRVRALVAGETVADSRGAHLLHETGHLPVYYFPPDDLRSDLLVPSETTTRCPYKGDASYYSCRVGDTLVEDLVWEYREPIDSASFIAGRRALYWRKVDAWLVEDEPALAHPRDPYHRIDVYSTSRRVRVLLDGECLADSRRAKGLFETGHPARWYIPPGDVRLDLLDPSPTQTLCAYKGAASHFHALGHQDVAWTYPEPLHDGERVRGLVAFYGERVDLELGGELQERPTTQWSR